MHRAAWALPPAAAAVLACCGKGRSCAADNPERDCPSQPLRPPCIQAPVRGAGPVPPAVDRALARHLPRPVDAEGLASDDGRRHRRDRRSHDPRRRPLAGRLRVLQLPRLRPRPRDHRRGPRLPRRLGHAPELVAPARQPGALRGDRGAADRAAGLRGLARPPDDHPHPHVGDPAAGRLGHDLPRRARAQDDLRRLPGRPRRAAPRSAASASRTPTTSTSCSPPSATPRAWSAWTA